MGVAIGNCYAGVIGKEDSRLVYDVWGKAINEAQQLKLTAEKSSIQCSKAMKKIFSGDYQIEKRTVEELHTYYIQGKKSGSSENVAFR
jgi:class 3 adenylate cyclase